MASHCLVEVAMRQPDGRPRDALDFASLEIALLGPLGWSDSSQLLPHLEPRVAEVASATSRWILHRPWDGRPMELSHFPALLLFEAADLCLAAPQVIDGRVGPAECTPQMSSVASSYSQRTQYPLIKNIP